MISAGLELRSKEQKASTLTIALWLKYVVFITYDVPPVVWPCSVVESVRPEPKLRVAVDGVAQDRGGGKGLGVSLDGLCLQLRESFFAAEDVGAWTE